MVSKPTDWSSSNKQYIFVYLEVSPDPRPVKDDILGRQQAKLKEYRDKQGKEADPFGGDRLKGPPPHQLIIVHGHHGHQSSRLDTHPSFLFYFCHVKFYGNKRGCRLACGPWDASTFVPFHTMQLNSPAYLWWVG